LDTFSGIARSFDAIYGLCDCIQVGVLKLLPGTEMRRRAEEFSMKFLDSPPYTVFENSTFSFDELRLLADIGDCAERFSVTGNPWSGAINFMIGLQKSPFDFYRKLSSYLAGFGAVPSKKIYGLLAQFAEKELGFEDAELLLIKEHLRYDYLLSNQGAVPVEIDKKYTSEQKEFLDKAKKELDELENFDRHSEELRKKLNECGEKLKKAGSSLTDSRVKAGEMLKNLVEKQLKYLDMPGVKFKVNVLSKPFSRDGADDIEFYVMTNAGEGYSPLSKTASGGELSRIMLAIKSVLAEKDGVDTLIFDEVDTGISGKTSRKIGLMMGGISKVCQVLCVTHSAQICSVADSHYLVSKSTSDDRTTTGVLLLDYNERVNETARIITGINVTDNSVSAAKELIDSKQE
jgi:hypothetical protein